MVRLRTVPKSHYVVSGSCKLESRLQTFVAWADWNLSATNAVIATDNGKLVGFFRYNIRKHNGGDRLYARGTWVRPGHRHRGVARRMWKIALKRAQEGVSVTVASKRMMKLVCGLKQQYSNLRWTIDSVGI